MSTLEANGSVEISDETVERIFAGPPWCIVVRANWPDLEDGAFTTVIGPIVLREEVNELLRNIGPAAKAYPLHTMRPPTVPIGFASALTMGVRMTTAVHKDTSTPYEETMAKL